LRGLARDTRFFSLGKPFVSSGSEEHASASTMGNREVLLFSRAGYRKDFGFSRPSRLLEGWPTRNRDRELQRQLFAFFFSYETMNGNDGETEHLVGFCVELADNELVAMEILGTGTINCP